MNRSLDREAPVNLLPHLFTLCTDRFLRHLQHRRAGVINYTSVDGTDTPAVFERGGTQVVRISLERQRPTPAPSSPSASLVPLSNDSHCYPVSSLTILLLTERTGRRVNLAASKSPRVLLKRTACRCRSCMIRGGNLRGLQPQV